MRYSLGAIEGYVQDEAVEGLEFTLYTVLDRSPVSCSLDPLRAATAAGLEGRRVYVEGKITREAESGTPLRIEDAWSVTDLPAPADPDQWKQARGILDLGDTSPEDAIRKIRDNWR